MDTVEKDWCFCSGNQIERINNNITKLLPWQEIVGNLKKLSKKEDILLVQINNNILQIEQKEIESKEINFLYNCINRKIGILKTNKKNLIRVI